MLALLGRLGYWGLTYWFSAALMAFLAVIVWIRNRRSQGGARTLTLISMSMCLLAGIAVIIDFLLAR